MKQRLELIGLDAVMALAAINLWTGSPLLALWVGSKAADGSRPTMTAVALVAVVMLACSLVLIRVLSGASALHEQLLGAPPERRRQAPWMRGLTAERTAWERERDARRLTVLDRVVVASVVLGVLAFEAWFFFLAGASF